MVAILDKLLMPASLSSPKALIQSGPHAEEWQAVVLHILVTDPSIMQMTKIGNQLEGGTNNQNGNI